MGKLVDVDEIDWQKGVFVNPNTDEPLPIVHKIATIEMLRDWQEEVKAIPIPEGATNGDVIKAMFPNQTISCAIPITDRNGAKFYRTTINGATDFTTDWWNAPYKKEVEE